MDQDAESMPYVVQENNVQLSIINILYSKPTHDLLQLHLVIKNLGREN